MDTAVKGENVKQVEAPEAKAGLSRRIVLLGIGVVVLIAGVIWGVRCPGFTASLPANSLRMKSAWPVGEMVRPPPSAGPRQKPVIGPAGALLP
jgi:hypothetical protein